MPNAEPLVTPGSQVSDFIVGGGPRLDALDREIVEIQTRLQDLLKRLNTLQANMQPIFKIYASDIAKEMEDVQTAYYDDSMTLATCYVERARLLRTLMQEHITHHEHVQKLTGEPLDDIEQEMQPKMKVFAGETSQLEKHIEQNGPAAHKYILDTHPAKTWFLDLIRAQKP